MTRCRETRVIEKNAKERFAGETMRIMKYIFPVRVSMQTGGLLLPTNKVLRNGRH